MELSIDTASAEPVYEQIVRQVESLVAAGQLPPGTPLPSIRQLADDLDLNPNTVARAFKILEMNRVILTAGRKGTFVRSEAVEQIAARQQQDLMLQMRDMVSGFLDKGLSAGEVEKAFGAAMQAGLVARDGKS